MCFAAYYVIHVRRKEIPHDRNLPLKAIVSQIASFVSNTLQQAAFFVGSPMDKQHGAVLMRQLIACVRAMPPNKAPRDTRRMLMHWFITIKRAVKAVCAPPARREPVYIEPAAATGNDCTDYACVYENDDDADNTDADVDDALNAALAACA